jgi:Holliday junction resolvase
MKPANQYLEAAKTEEIARQLETEGYEVAIGSEDADHRYDIIATKNGERIAIEVKVRSDLAASEETIRRLRKQAREHGYRFRLVIVSPPHEARIRIEGIEEELLHHLINALPPELEALSSGTRLSDVTGIEIDEIQATAEGLHIAGSGVVDVELEYGGSSDRDGANWSTDFPFTFDVLLDHNLHIQRVNRIDVDTSSFFE